MVKGIAGTFVSDKPYTAKPYLCTATTGNALIGRAYTYVNDTTAIMGGTGAFMGIAIGANENVSGLTSTFALVTEGEVYAEVVGTFAVNDMVTFNADGKCVVTELVANAIGKITRYAGANSTASVELNSSNSKVVRV